MRARGSQSVTLSRRGFVQASAAASFLAAIGFGHEALAESASGIQDPTSDETPQNASVTAEYPTQDPAVVREVVGASHVRFDRVQELVTARPTLANAAWDWGFGDWETALGAASHMGRRDIARFLMSHGARPDIFTFAMLGHVDTVKSLVNVMPGVQRTPGPHGITLLQHAANGLRRAESDDERRDGDAMVAYLESLGDADQRVTSLPVSDEEKTQYLGKYRFGDGEDAFLDVHLDSRGGLALRRGQQVARKLHRLEGDVFSPSGAPAVRVQFEMQDARAVALTIADSTLVLRAVRTV